MIPSDQTTKIKLGLRKLGLDIGATLGRQLLSLVLGLATAAIIARTLGPTGNGQYAVAMLLPTSLATFLNLGISSANVYYVGRHSVTPCTAFQANLRIWFVVVTLGVTIGTISILFYSDQWFPGVPPLWLWLALISFPLGLLQGYLSSLLQAVQDFHRYNLSIIASSAIMLALASLFLLFGGNVGAVIMAAVIVQIINLIITWRLVRPLIVISPNDQDEQANINRKSYAKQAIQYGYKAHLSNILTFVNYRADLFLVNFLLNPAAAGVYVIAVTMSEKLWILSQAVSTVILPRLSELHAEEETRRQLTPFLARWVLIITIAATFVLAFTSSYLIQIIFGAAYIEAIMPLLLLLPGIVLITPARVFANDIAARGRPDLNMYTALLVVVANIVGNLLLIPRLGLSGAALATTTAYTLQAVLLVWMYCWLSGNHWYDIFRFNSHDARALKQMRQLLWK